METKKLPEQSVVLTVSCGAYCFFLPFITTSFVLSFVGASSSGSSAVSSLSLRESRLTCAQNYNGINHFGIGASV